MVQSIQITSQSPQPPPNTIRVILKLSHAGKIRLLMESIQEASQCLPLQRRKEVLDWFSEWQRQFNEGYDPNSPLDRERLKAASALCCLIHNGLDYVMCEIVVENKEKVAWFGLRSQTLQIIEDLLPNRSAEEFLETYIQSDSEEKFTEEELLAECAKIKERIERLEEELPKRANQVNEKLIRCFEKFKEKLLKVQKASELKKVYERLDALSDKVSRLYKVSKKEMKKLKKIERRMQQQDASLTRNLNASEKLIN